MSMIVRKLELRQTACVQLSLQSTEILTDIEGIGDDVLQVGDGDFGLPNPDRNLNGENVANVGHFYYVQVKLCCHWESHP